MKIVAYHLIGFAIAYVLVYFAWVGIGYSFLCLFWLFGNIDGSEFRQEIQELHKELLRQYLLFLRDVFYWIIWLCAGLSAGLVNSLTTALSQRGRLMFRRFFDASAVMLIYAIDAAKRGLPYDDPLLNFIMYPIMIAAQFYMGTMFSTFLPKLIVFLSETRVVEIMEKMRSMKFPWFMRRS